MLYPNPSYNEVCYKGTAVYLPSPDISPILTILGQCCNVLAKNGFVTPNITGGLKQNEKSQ